MRVPRWVSQAKGYAVTSALRLLSHRLEGAVSLLAAKPAPQDYGLPEREYTARDGRKIPVFGGYRYSVKPAWSMFPGLNLLGWLEAWGRLSEAETAYFRNAIGTRTVTVPLVEAAAAARKAAELHSDLFIPDAKDDGRLPVPRPVEADVRKRIEAFRDQNSFILKRLSAAGVFTAPAGASILEIGYVSGGHSIFAFEQLGFRAFGVDNSYGGIEKSFALHNHIKAVIGSNATFEFGDITKLTPFPSESMDVVYSSSVLEHVQDLDKALAEMYRLLKPGGAIIHNYHPYFCHDGGHALGIGDSPWMHVRLDESEYLDYLSEMRPYEIERTRPWFQCALHRDVPQWRMQRLVAEAGFEIRLWVAKPSKRRWLKDLTPAIIRECLTATPGIAVEDLTAKSVSLVAVKPAR